MTLKQLKQICEGAKKISDEYNQGKYQALSEMERLGITKKGDAFSDTFYPSRVLTLLNLLEEAKELLKCEEHYSLVTSVGRTGNKFKDCYCDFCNWFSAYEKELGE